MAKCYWGLCTPSTTDCCPEHNGVGCALKLFDQQDPVTQELERAIGKCENDQQALDATEKELEKKRLELETIETELKAFEQELRSATLTRLPEDIQRDAETRQARIEEIVRAVEDLKNSVSAFPSIDINAWDNLLHYAPKDPACTCEDEKVHQLALLLDAIVREKKRQRQLVSGAQSLYTRIKITGFSAGASLGGLLSRLALALVFGWTIAGIIIFVVALLAFIASVYYYIQASQNYINKVRDAVHKTSDVLKSILLYYRTKLTPTCTLCPPKKEENASKPIDAGEPPVDMPQPYFK